MIFQHADAVCSFEDLKCGRDATTGLEDDLVGGEDIGGRIFIKSGSAAEKPKRIDGFGVKSDESWSKPWILATASGGTKRSQ